MKKYLFGKFTMKMSHFWKIYHENKTFLGNLTYKYGKFSIMWEYFHGNRYSGKIPMHTVYGDMPRDGGESGKKNCSDIQWSWWSKGYSRCLPCCRLGLQTLQTILGNLAAKFPSGHGNLEIRTWKLFTYRYTNENSTLYP
jgi:hypothetical protein